MTRDLLNAPDQKQPLQDRAMLHMALAAFFVLLALLVGILVTYQIWYSDPYVQNVLSLDGDPVRGHAIFQMNCSSCHGLYANGLVGPSLQNVADHKSRVSLIHQVTSGQTPPMPQFQPSPQEMADLLKYLESL